MRNSLQSLYMATSCVQVNSTCKTHKMRRAHSSMVGVHGDWTCPSHLHGTDSVRTHSCCPQILCAVSCNAKSSLNIVRCYLESSDLHLNLEGAFCHRHCPMITEVLPEKWFWTWQGLALNWRVLGKKLKSCYFHSWVFILRFQENNAWYFWKMNGTFCLPLFQNRLNQSASIYEIDICNRGPLYIGSKARKCVHISLLPCSQFYSVDIG